HLDRVGIALHRDVAERKAEVAGPHFGKAETGNREDRLAVCDALGALDLDAEQELAPRIERPGIAARHVILAREAPDRRCRRFRAEAARAHAEQESAILRAGAIYSRLCAAHALERLRHRGVDTESVLRIACGLDERARSICLLGLA